jgi:peptidoglycan hydrolase FlgJ
MSFSDPLNVNALAVPNGRQPQGTRDDRALRRAATEFEALLLKQLTVALNPAEDDEDSLFGDSNGNGMYKQMFSEQLALALARGGGVGLAETILQQLHGLRDSKADSGVSTPARVPQAAQRVIEVARAVRNAPAALNQNNTTLVEVGQALIQPEQPDRLKSVPRLPLAATASVATPVATVEAPAVSTPLTLPTALPGTPAASATVASAPATVALHLPVRGRISSTFGLRRDPLHGGHRQHGGLDIAAARGTPIAAAAAGKVVFAGQRGGYGNLVELAHADGRRTRYAHADKILVTLGEEVQQGQPVATVGSTGRSTGAHVHFEVREQGSKVDPLTVVAKDFSTKRR